MTHVTIPAADNYTHVVVGGTPSTGPFAFDFPYFSSSDIKVEKIPSNGSATSTLVPSVVTGDDDGGTITGGYVGGEITLGTAVQDCTLRIYRETVVARTTDFPSAGQFTIAVLNTELDKLIAIMQDHYQALLRTVRLPAADTAALNALPGAAARASQLLGFDANGQPIASGGTGGITISAAMTPVVQAATLSAARTAMALLRNERLAKTANYTVANADNGKTIACGTAPWTLTFSTISGGNYDADFWVYVVNESSTRAILCSIGGGTNFWLYPGQTALVFNQNSTWRFRRDGRWRLTGATTIYVDGTNGSNSNDGLASGSGNAFLTWAQARTVLANDVDFNGQTVTVQIADGTYTASLSIASTINFMGGGKLVLQGNTGTPANVVISTTSDHAVRVQGHKSVEVNITGMTLQTTTAGSCVYAYAGGVVRIGSAVRIGAGAWGGLVASEGGQIWVDANIEILAAATLPFAVNTNGYLNCVSKTVTYTGTPAWNPACARAIGGLMDFAGCTMSGAATGKRYDATENGVIRVGGGGANYFPGSVAGTTATGGQYN